MRRLGLSLVLAIIGLGLIAGSVIHFLPPSSVPSSLLPLDRYVGTQGSVVGAVFGAGLLLAALDPHRNLVWVYLGVAYGILLVVAELFTSRDLAGIIWGLATAALLLALHPIRPRAAAPAKPVPAATPAAPAAKAEVSTPQPRSKPAPPPAHKEGSP